MLATRRCFHVFKKSRSVWYSKAPNTDAVLRVLKKSTLEGCSARVLGHRHRVGHLRDFGVRAVQQHADHNGVRTRTLLRPHGRHVAVLRDDVRDGHKTDAADVRTVARRSRSVAGALLLGALHQDQPHLAHLQPRSQGDGEAAELYQSAIPAGNLLLPGRST